MDEIDSSKSPSASRTPVASPKLAGGGTEQARKKVRRKKKVKEGPKFPQTGYVRYMNDRRDELRLLMPNATAIEHTKMIGEEWTSMPDDKKQPYLAAAEIDRERYNKECKSYKEMKSEETKKSPSHVQVKVPKKPIANAVYFNGPSDNPNSSPATSVDVVSGQMELTMPKNEPRTGNYDIPIFTEEFLEHNKVVDFELRLLRKSNTDYEQQNSVLEKHVENMANGVNKLKDEMSLLELSNEGLRTYIEVLKSKLIGAFASLPTPSHSSGATGDNIEAYMGDLMQMTTSNSHGPAVLNKAKDIMRKLDVYGLPSPHCSDD